MAGRYALTEREPTPGSRLWRAIACAAGEGIDRLFAHAAFRSRHASRRALRDTPGDRVAHFHAAAEIYARHAADGRLFPEPRRAAPSLGRVARKRDGAVWDLEWPTGWRPLHGEFAQLAAAHPENARCRARWWRHDQPAPVAVCLHGWGGGPYALESHAFRARALYDAGLDVVLLVLPFHAARRRLTADLPPFPSTNPYRTNEGLAQAVLDLRALCRFLEGEVPAAGVIGMSLGGFTAALAATVDSRLAFVVPMIPVASIADMIWELGRGSRAHQRATEQGLTRAHLEAALAPTSPLLRTPRVASDRVLCIAGRRDRVVSLDHPERLRRHLSSRELVLFEGTHLVQLGKDRALERVFELVRELDVAGQRRAAAGGAP